MQFKEKPRSAVIAKESAANPQTNSHFCERYVCDPVTLELNSVDRTPILEPSILASREITMIHHQAPGQDVNTLICARLVCDGRGWKHHRSIAAEKHNF